MKVAYVLATPRAASYKLGQMILPQLEAGTHGARVVAMFFFDDNVFILHRGDPVGEPVDTVDGVRVGCFPDLYAALAQDPPDQVVTL